MNTRGFTLIEIMVAISIFTIVMMVSMGAVLSIVEANRKSQSLNVVVNNLNFAFESMIRDLRTGSSYVLGDCSGGECSQVDLVNRNDEEVSYFLNEDGVIEKDYVDPSLAQGPITDNEVNITNMSFALTGEGSGDGEQLLLRIHLQGEVGAGQTKSAFNIQTLVTPRSLDL